MSQLFEAFCVMKNQGRLPISVLQWLWGLSLDESFLVIEKLSDLSIITQHTEDRNLKFELLDVSISAHDLVLAYSKNLARQSAREGMWHGKVLDSYKCSEPNAEWVDDTEEITSVPFLKSPRPWWDIKSDGYILSNVSRHMSIGGYTAELSGLVTDIRWTKLRFKEGGLLELENDIDMLLSTLGKNDSSLSDEYVLSKDVQILRRELRLSWGAIHKNPRECGFQLFFRLCHYKDRSNVISKYLKSIEDWNEKPWLRPFPDQDTAMDGRRALETFVSDCWAAAWSPDEKKIIYGSERDVVVFNVIRCEEEFRFLGHKAAVMCLSCAGNGRHVASGSQDNTIRLWDLETKTPIGEPLTGHSQAVTSVAISGNGQTLISASEDNTVRLWHFEGDTLTRKYRRRFSSKVGSVSITENGQRAMSSGGIVWNTRRMKRIGKVLSRNEKFPSISQVGQQLLSGSWDGTVKLWNLEEKPTGQPIFKVPTTPISTQVSMSRDGRRVAATHYGTARVWDTSTGKQIGTPLDAKYMALNRDGSQLLASNWDHITVWDVSETAEQSDRCHVHGGLSRYKNDCVYMCLAYCPEAKMIASTSADGTLHLWNADTGLPSAEPLSIFRGIFHHQSLALSQDGRKAAIFFHSIRTISVWDVHARREIAKISVARRVSEWCNILGISAHGKYVFIQDGFDDVTYIWDVSKSAPIAISQNEVSQAFQSDIALMEKRCEERGSIMLGSEQQLGSIETHPRSLKVASTTLGEWQLKIENGREVILVKNNHRVVIGTLHGYVHRDSWIVYRSSQGEQVLVTVYADGHMHWFTVEM